MAAFCFPYKPQYNAEFCRLTNNVCVADKAAVLHPCQTSALYPAMGSTTHVATHREKNCPICGEKRRP